MLVAPTNVEKVNSNLIKRPQSSSVKSVKPNIRERYSSFKKERGYARSYSRNVASPSIDIEMGIINEDKTKLISEQGSSSSGSWASSHEIPKWVRIADDIKSEFKDVEERMSDLAFMHKKHLGEAFQERDDNIEMTTAEITTQLLQLQKRVRSLVSEAEVKLIKGAQITGTIKVSPQELMIKRNAQKNLAGILTKISLEFRTSQQEYMKKLQNKAHKTSSAEKGRADPLDALDKEFPDDLTSMIQSFDKGFSATQLAVVDDMEAEEQQYTEQINNLRKSIIEIHEMFVDLYSMVDEQGNMLDRIDFLVENTQYNVQQANIELVKAKEYTKKTGRKIVMLLLLVLIFGCIIMLLLKIIF